MTNPAKNRLHGLGVWLDGNRLGLEPIRIGDDMNGNVCVWRAAFPESLIRRATAYLRPLGAVME